LNSILNSRKAFAGCKNASNYQVGVRSRDSDKSETDIPKKDITLFIVSTPHVIQYRLTNQQASFWSNTPFRLRRVVAAMFLIQSGLRSLKNSNSLN
jgi:hypothetical protein